MSRFTQYIAKASTITAALFALALCLTARPAAAQSTHDNYIYEDEGFLDRLQDFDKTTSNPFEDVPPDHWAYKAVKRLADAGLLNGYSGQLFRGDQVVTRYEMAMLVSKLLDGYLEWYKSGGRITKEEYTTATWPDIAGSGPAPPTRQSGAPLKAISAPDAVIAPSRRVSVDLPSLGSMSIEKSTPKTMDQMQSTATPYNAGFTMTPEIEGQITDITKKVVKENLNLDMKKIDDLQKLVNEFKNELKDQKKEFAKQIKEANKISLQNKKSIESLERENERFKITGTERFFWFTGGPITGDGCLVKDPNDTRCNLRTANLANSITLTFKSKPDKGLDLDVGGAFSAYTKLGGKRIYKGDRSKDPGFDSSGTDVYDYSLQQAGAAFRGYIEGSNTALQVSNLYINYNAPPDDAKNPRNFRLRSLYVGDTSVFLSPMTIMGKPIQGMVANLQLNDYSLTIFGARERLHQIEPYFLPDVVDNKDTWKFNTTFFNQDQFDRYKYGISLETNLFGNPASRANFTRIFTFDNKDTNYPGCDTGKWIDLSFSYDHYAQSSPDSDISSTDLFCAPPIKNSVSSVFVIYPMFSGINLMGEYAHSTYYKPGYKLLKPFDKFGSGGVDTNNMSGKYQSWWDSKEENDQDDAFLVLFNYNKGPITIFPIGYIHLGPNFVTDLDISAFGGNFDISSAMSILPISIKSIDGMVGSLKYEFKDKSVANTLFAELKENHPMYFDPGALAGGFASNGSKGTILGILNTALGRINNRTSLLDVKVWNSSYKTFLANNISLSIGYTKVGAALPRSCLDGDVITIFNDFGGVVDKTIGNGTSDCRPDANNQDVYLGLKYWLTQQNYQVDWDTSNRTHFVFGYSIKDSDLKLSLTKQVEDIIQNLAPKGKNYQLFSELKYKISSSTRFKIYYEMNYDRYPVGLDTYVSANPSAYKFPVIDNQKFLFTVESNF